MGYKVVASCDEQGLVTAVEVVPGNESEIEQVASLQQAWDELGLHPRAVAADSAYDAAHLREELAQCGVRIYAPTRYRRSTLPEGFAYDREANQVLCPAGQVGRPSPHGNGGFLYVFSQSACRVCPLQAQCLKAGAQRKVVYFHPGKHQLRPKGLRVAMRIRKVIERVFAEAKKWHGLGRARYRGRLGVAFQAVMTFFVLNTKKLSRWEPARAAFLAA